MDLEYAALQVDGECTAESQIRRRAVFDFDGILLREHLLQTPPVV